MSLNWSHIWDLIFRKTEQLWGQGLLSNILGIYLCMTFVPSNTIYIIKKSQLRFPVLNTDGLRKSTKRCSYFCNVAFLLICEPGTINQTLLKIWFAKFISSISKFLTMKLHTELCRTGRSWWREEDCTGVNWSSAQSVGIYAEMLMSSSSVSWLTAYWQTSTIRNSV